MNQIDIGPAATVKSGTTATLYLMKIPVGENDGGEPIESITLPNIGTDLTNTCDNTNNALHVFAITTSLN